MALYRTDSLYTPSGGKIPTINPSWVIWLQENDRFSYDDSEGGSFTARKEQRPSGEFWYGFATIGGKTLKRYIGKSEQIDVTRLNETAKKFKALREQK